jgi:hypothetical protein
MKRLPLGAVVALCVLVAVLGAGFLAAPSPLRGWPMLLLLGTGIGALSYLWLELPRNKAHPRRNGLIVGGALGLLFLMGFRLQAYVDPISIGVAVFSGLVAGILAFRDSARPN